MAAATAASKVRKHVAQHELRQSLSQALPAGYGSSPETASAENSVLSETTAIPAATARSLARTRHAKVNDALHLEYPAPCRASEDLRACENILIERSSILPLRRPKQG